jgi:hypothetical protein
MNEKDLTPDKAENPTDVTVQNDRPTDASANEAGDQPEARPAAAPEASLGDALGDKLAEPEKKTVGLDKYLTEKNKRKELEAELEKVKEAKDDGATKAEIQTDLQAIADEYNLDADVLAKVGEALQAKANAALDERLEPILNDKRVAARDAKFKELYDNAIANAPEYDGVVNVEVIKQLATNSANKDKTMSQLIEGTYGHLLGSKSSIERSQNTRIESGKIDMKEADQNPEYFKKVLADPTLKGQYDQNVLDNIQL